MAAPSALSRQGKTRPCLIETHALDTNINIKALVCCGADIGFSLKLITHTRI